MEKYLAKAQNKSGKYAMFIGRWQPWHKGHRWLIDQALNQGKKVLLCIRDVPVSESNPWTAYQIFLNLNKELKNLIDNGDIKIEIIPDIESINIGRGVGYDIIEHTPPQEIHDISATKIREQLKQEGKL
jgi:cytidyltransferase-like protein